ncbi:hypothetical protein BYT27DRAFT_6847257 [Phlegmacium glaucopus]|nr:hypothetical protein BYT27DRAFT_6847257 [Phlegmacium glaucopus]
MLTLTATCHSIMLLHCRSLWSASTVHPTQRLQIQKRTLCLRQFQPQVTQRQKLHPRSHFRTPIAHSLPYTVSQMHTCISRQLSMPITYQKLHPQSHFRTSISHPMLYTVSKTCTCISRQLMSTMRPMRMEMRIRRLESL